MLRFIFTITFCCLPSLAFAASPFPDINELTFGKERAAQMRQERQQRDQREYQKQQMEQMRRQTELMEEQLRIQREQQRLQQSGY